MADKINESIVWGRSQPHQRTGDGQDEVQLIDLPHVLLNRAPSRARVEPSPPARSVRVPARKHRRRHRAPGRRMSGTVGSSVTPAGAEERRGGGQFAGRIRNGPLESLGAPSSATIARASAGDAQVVYERDGDKIRVTVLLRETDSEGNPIWVEEGSVLTSTPTSARPEQFVDVITGQATRIADADDPHEETARFLAGLEGRTDPAITRAPDRLAS